MIDLFSATWIDVDRYELRPDARRFENWENNYAARLGLRSAIDYALGIGLHSIEAEVIRLAARLRKMLARVNGVTVHDIGKRKCGIVSFSVAGVEAGEVATRLMRDGVHVSVTTPDGTLIDATRRHLPDMVRASVHYFNQDAELDRLIELVETIAAG
jgi:selenocysteine lyase/cysteine desulfurase